MAYADFDSYQGNFKKVYAKEIKNSFPKATRLVNKLSFNNAARIGDEYQEPILLSREQGVTYAGTGKLVTLNAAVAANIQFGKIKSSEIDLRTGFPYTMITRSMGQGAFDRTNSLAMMGLRETHYHRLEADFWHGQSTNGWGVVNTSAANVVTPTVATWAPGLWIFNENMKIDSFSSAGVYKGTATVTAVDIDNKNITVDNGAIFANTDVIYPNTARDPLGNFNQMLGVRQVLATNTGTVFSISATSYSMWKPTVVSIGATSLSFARINKGFSQAMSRGFGPEAIMWVNPSGYADLIAEIEGARHFTLEYAGGSVTKQGKAGMSKIPGQVERGGGGENFLKFYSASGASVTIIPHEYIMEGEAFAMSDDNSWFKVGSSDVTFELPLEGIQMSSGLFINLPNQNGYEIRSYSDMAIFTNRRCGNIYFNNIVNN